MLSLLLDEVVGPQLAFCQIDLDGLANGLVDVEEFLERSGREFAGCAERGQQRVERQGQRLRFGVLEPVRAEQLQRFVAILADPFQCFLDCPDGRCGLQSVLLQLLSQGKTSQ